MNANHRKARRLRSKAWKPDRIRVAYVPVPSGPEEIPIHCFDLGSLRSRR
jgi:hypothetical protein